MARNRRSRNISISGHASLVSGDRRRSGLFALWSILRNFTIGSLGSEGAFGVVFSRRERATFDEWKDRLQIVASDPDELITTLSGGNQQKVLIARALAAHPQILLLDDPTRGVDATTKLELYEMLRSSAANGMAVLWYSTEDDEMLQCDRAYVMREGVVEHELRGAELSREAIVTASFAPGGSHREVATAVEATEPRSRWAWALTPRGWFLIALVLAILVVATGFAAPDALSLSGLPTLTNSFTPLVLAAAAELMIISVADIDLGVGAYMGLVNAVSATWMISHPWLGGLALVGFLVLYVLQGLIVAVRKVPAIIVTLGFSFVWLGIALVILPTPGGTSPGWLTSVGAATWTFPEPLVIAIVVGTLTTLMFFRTHLGVRIRAVGNNADSYAIREHSTRHAIRERVVAWAFAGIFATLAGLSVTALTSSADPSASSSDTLLAIAAVIVGGGEFVGGIVEPAGAVLGALMFGLLQAYLALTSINVNYTSLVEGIVLVAVLGLRLIFRPQVAAALSRRSVPFARRRSGGDSGPSLPLEPESPGFGSGGDTGSISSSAVS
jgi:ribose transport system ATP-binding protein